jgi:putative glycerol-1-phosphate prenyltransferase
VTTFYEILKNGQQQQKKLLAVLIDPDKMSDQARLRNLLELIRHSQADFILIGGSLLTQDHFEECVQQVKAGTTLPVILFPGSPSQISDHADSILLLSLISGRNADLLIGQHVVAAPRLKRSSLEIIPTGYMLVDCGKSTTASYISQTFPLPWNKPEIALATALAGEMLGMRCIYLDGGSGAEKPISAEMISAVHEGISLPLIVGGGIRTEEQAFSAWNAGADLVVIGTAFENEPELLFSISAQRSAKP